MNTWSNIKKKAFFKQLPAKQPPGMPKSCPGLCVKKALHRLQDFGGEKKRVRENTCSRVANEQLFNGTCLQAQDADRRLAAGSKSPPQKKKLTWAE